MYVLGLKFAAYEADHNFRVGPGKNVWNCTSHPHIVVMTQCLVTLAQ